MSVTPSVVPTLPTPATPDTVRGDASPDDPGADFAQVLDALLSPARGLEPVLVPGASTAGAASPQSESAPARQREDPQADGSAAAVSSVPAPALPQALPQGVAPLVALPAAALAPSNEPGPVLGKSSAVNLSAPLARAEPAPARGPVRAFEPAADEPTRTAAVVELAPAASAQPAKIAAEPVPSPPDAAPIPAAAADAPVVTVTEHQEPVGLVPVERAGRAPDAAPRADPNQAGLRIDAPDFADEVGSRVVWMAGRNQQAAEFRIDPPQLGPVEVRLSMSNDQASLVLLSPHASVRDALQATLPRLQDLLAGAGINLGSVHVGTSGHSGGQAGDQSGPGRNPAAEAALPGADQPSTWITRGRGMVDVYA